MSATASPATAAAASPNQGLAVNTVTAAAENAPASIIPSSAILITPPRSEYMPPRAARISGVDSRIIEASKDRLIMFSMPPIRCHSPYVGWSRGPSPTHLNFSRRALLHPKAKCCFTRYKYDDYRLEHHRPRLRNSVIESVYEKLRPVDRAEQYRGEQSTDWMIAAQ